LEWWVFCL